MKNASHNLCIMFRISYVYRRIFDHNVPFECTNMHFLGYCTNVQLRLAVHWSHYFIMSVRVSVCVCLKV